MNARDVVDADANIAATDDDDEIVADVDVMLSKCQIPHYGN